MRGTLKEAPENPPVRMETITLRQTSQSADRQTAWGAMDKGEWKQSLIIFQTQKRKTEELRPEKLQ